MDSHYRSKTIYEQESIPVGSLLPVCSLCLHGAFILGAFLRGCCPVGVLFLRVGWYRVVTGSDTPPHPCE